MQAQLVTRRKSAMPAPAITALACGMLLPALSWPQTCDPALADSILATEKFVDLLSGGRFESVSARPDSASRRWIQGEIGLIRDACARARDVEAAWRLEQIRLKLPKPGSRASEAGYRQATDYLRVRSSPAPEPRIARPKPTADSLIPRAPTPAA